jgi:5-deoxy-5-amino-3-dehydroquinate dehydratase
MPKILLINGPNLSRLGTRKPDVYGTVTLADIERKVVDLVDRQQMSCFCFCHNSEGAIIDFIDQHRDADAMIINPGALMMSGWSLRDALEDFAGYCVEVHISNVWSRESFRHESVLSPVVNGVIAGMGTQCYSLALLGIVEQLNINQANSNGL